VDLLRTLTRRIHNAVLSALKDPGLHTYAQRHVYLRGRTLIIPENVRCVEKLIKIIYHPAEDCNEVQKKAHVG
jgi:hypothetical protein